MVGEGAGAEGAAPRWSRPRAGVTRGLSACLCPRVPGAAHRSPRCPLGSGICLTRGRAPPPSLMPLPCSGPAGAPQASGGGCAHCQPAELPQALLPGAHHQGDAGCWPLQAWKGFCKLRPPLALLPWSSTGPGSHRTPPGLFPAQHSEVRKQSPIHRESVTCLPHA